MKRKQIQITDNLNTHVWHDYSVEKPEKEGNYLTILELPAMEYSGLIMLGDNTSLGSDFWNGTNFKYESEPILAWTELPPIPEKWR